MCPQTPIVNNHLWNRGVDMTMFRIIRMFVGMTLAITICSPPLRAQSSSAGKQPDSISIHITLQKSNFAVGEKPIGVVAITNTSQHEVCLLTAPDLYRVHVATKDSESPKTEFHRHLRGEFRPGDGPDLAPGPVDCRAIAVGSQDSLKFDLSAFYDLSSPGDYSVYLEIYDPVGPKDGSGHWLRTNTVKFKVEAPTQ